MKINLLLILFSLLSASAQAWEGPPGSIGSGLIRMGKPSNYIDTSFTGGNTPLVSALKTNFIISQSEKDTVQLYFNLIQTQLNSATLLSNTQSNVATNLWGINLGSLYSHRLENKDDWGLISSVGSDSDIPFNSMNELSFQTTALYHKIVDPLHSWYFFLNYSLNRAFLPGIPLPGAGYLTINPVNRTQIFLGIPFFAAWQFQPQWNLSLTYLVPYTVNMQLDYRVNPQMKLFSKFEWFTQTWLRAFRSDNMNRIIYDQKRVTAGVSQSLGAEYFISAFAGFAFDQQIYEARSQTFSNGSSQFLSAGLLGQIEFAKTF